MGAFHGRFAENVFRTTTTRRDLIPENSSSGDLSPEKYESRGTDLTKVFPDLPIGSTRGFKAASVNLLSFPAKGGIGANDDNPKQLPVLYTSILNSESIFPFAKCHLKFNFRAMKLNSLLVMSRLQEVGRYNSDVGAYA